LAIRSSASATYVSRLAGGNGNGLNGYECGTEIPRSQLAKFSSSQATNTNNGALIKNVGWLQNNWGQNNWADREVDDIS